jgi:hypothetical protein
MAKVKVDIKDLENFMDYLQDKVEDCYKAETQRAIKEYLAELEGAK